jgi:hypothetical protein
MKKKVQENEIKKQEAFEKVDNKKKALEELELENIRIKAELEQQQLLEERDNATGNFSIKKQKYGSLDIQEEIKMMDSKPKENEIEELHVENTFGVSYSYDQQQQKMLIRNWEEEKPYVQEEVNSQSNQLIDIKERKYEIHERSVVTDNNMLETIEGKDKEIERLREENEKKDHEKIHLQSRLEEKEKEIKSLKAKRKNKLLDSICLFM